MKNGTILFVGYSFRDRLVFDVMEELIDVNGVDRIPWSYAFFEHVERDEKTTSIFSRHRIIPLECSFEELMESLGKGSGNSVVPQPPSEMLFLKGRRLPIIFRPSQVVCYGFRIFE